MRESVLNNPPQIFSMMPLRLSSLPEWNSLLPRLQSVPTVSDVDVIAMNIGEARVSFSYTGTPDQLRSAAAQANLTLTDAEKREMAAVDGRASALLARTEAMAREQLRELHGALRNPRSVPEEGARG